MYEPLLISDLWKKNFRLLEKFQIFRKFSDFRKRQKTLREHPQRAILETCDLRLDTQDTDYTSTSFKCWGKHKNVPGLRRFVFDLRVSTSVVAQCSSVMMLSMDGSLLPSLMIARPFLGNNKDTWHEQAKQYCFLYCVYLPKKNPSDFKEEKHDIDGCTSEPVNHPVHWVHRMDEWPCRAK